MGQSDGPTRELRKAAREYGTAIDSKEVEACHDTISIPHNEDQAVAMVNIGIAWLKAHAPHRLKP